MNFLDKRTKINILQKRANLYNEKFDQLEQEGYDLDDIPQIIKSQEESQKTIVKSTLPFEENTKVINVGSAFQQGYAGSHKILSQTKQQYKEIDDFAKTIKNNPNDEKIQKYKSIFNKKANFKNKMKLTNYQKLRFKKTTLKLCQILEKKYHLQIINMDIVLFLCRIYK